MQGMDLNSDSDSEADVVVEVLEATLDLGEDEDEVKEEDEGVEQTDAAEATRRQAEAEGLTLLPADNKTGYLRVYEVSGLRGSRQFAASVRRAGKKVHLGSFSTAEEAALAYARTPEARGEVATSNPAPLTAEEAVEQATAEGLKLESSDSASGYRGVSYEGSRYHARLGRDGRRANLGSFATAEEAALAVARAAARPCPKPASPTATAKEAVTQAAAEGLTLERSYNCAAGFRGVKVWGSGYQARARVRGGKQVHLGSFATAEEAALAVARAVARTDDSLPRLAAAKRATQPPKPPPAKQPRSSLAPGALRGGEAVEGAEPLLAFIGLVVLKMFEGTPVRPPAHTQLQHSLCGVPTAQAALHFF